MSSSFGPADQELHIGPVWSPIGNTVEVSSDAHSGQRALRFLRTPDTESPETGLNRGLLVDRLKGGIDLGFGPAELFVVQGVAPSSIAWVPRLAHIVLEGADGGHSEQVVLTEEPRKVEATERRTLFFRCVTPEGEGLLWNVYQKWDGRRDRPCVMFSSPDGFENLGSHLVGLFLPSVSEFVEVDEREASTPYSLVPDKPLRLTARGYADGEATDALAAVDE